MKPSAANPQPITLAADATTLPSVYRSLETRNRYETFTLFLRVALIERLQSTSVVDHFNPRQLPCFTCKVSRRSDYSGRRGDSAVLYCFIYTDII